MTRAELRDLNRRLAAFGQRFCPGCEAVLDLTEGNWYFSRRGRDRLKLRASSKCIRCTCLKQSEKERKRYRHDKAFREAKARYRVFYFAQPANRQHHRAQGRVYMQAKRRAQRKLHFTRIVQSFSLGKSK
jgi:hypothetical protein